MSRNTVSNYRCDPLNVETITMIYESNFKLIAELDHLEDESIVFIITEVLCYRVIRLIH